MTVFLPALLRHDPDRKPAARPQRRMHCRCCAAIMRVSCGDLRSMPKIVVTDRDGNQHEVEGRAGLKVMETLRELDYGVLAICGGLCSCATCHVLVDPEWVEKL